MGYILTSNADLKSRTRVYVLRGLRLVHILGRPSLFICILFISFLKRFPNSNTIDCSTVRTIGILITNSNSFAPHESFPLLFSPRWLRPQGHYAQTFHKRLTQANHNPNVKHKSRKDNPANHNCEQITIAWKHHQQQETNAKKLSERKVISPNTRKAQRNNLILRDADRAKTLKAVKTILKTIKKAHGKDKVKKTRGKKLKEPASSSTDTDKYHLIRHGHLWKNCPNDLRLKNYSETHYSQIQEQERAGSPSRNEDKNTKSDDELKRPRKKRHHKRSRNEVKSTDCDTSIYVSPMVKFSLIRELLMSKHSLHSESTVCKGNIF